MMIIIIIICTGLGVRGRIMLKWVSMKYNGRAETGFVRLRTGATGGLL
jgi:hypothetical protein